MELPQMPQTKSLKEYYNTHTPKFYRMLGDALLGVSAFITTSAIATDNKLIAYIALGIGIVGKFLSNFFVDNNQNGNN